MELQSEKYVQIIVEEAALEVERNDKSLYVFSDFTSDAFEHCRKVRFYITHLLHSHTSTLDITLQIQYKMDAIFLVYDLVGQSL